MSLMSPRLAPLWWRIPVWIALTVVTVLAAHTPTQRVTVGVLMSAAWIVLQFEAVARPRWLAPTTGPTASALSLVACYFAPGGLTPVVVCVAIARTPFSLPARALRAYTAAMTVAFGVTIAVISHSWLGLLAGIAAPLLVQRTVEHQELVRARDRAQALLAEAQRGREAEAHAAALQERGRIAREMHDVLAHSLAGLSVQLQAVRAVALREHAGAAVLDPLDKAAALARDGLAEARSAVGTLRDPVGLGMAELPALVERHPGAATLTTTGEPGALPAETGHAVYRAVQESLTNAARHAPGATVAVTVAWRPDEVEVCVRDSGARREPVRDQGTGLGLAGMTERLVQAGGHVTAGPDGEGGWLVRAVLPR